MHEYRGSVVAAFVWVSLSFVATVVLASDGEDFEKFTPRDWLNRLKFHPDDHERDYGARRLVGQARRAKELVPEVVPLATHTDARMRRRALEVLAAIGGKEPKVQQILLDALRDKNGKVRRTAAYQLGRYARFSILLAQLDHPDPVVQSVLVEQLAYDHEEADKVVSAFIERINRRQPPIRAELIRNLGRIGKSARRAIPTLVRLCDHKDEGIRSLCCFALGEIGHDDGSVGVALVRRFNDPHEWARGSALEAVGKIEPKVVGAVPALRQICLDQNNKHWLEATKSLWQISQDRLAPEFLLRIVENGNDERRRQAVFPLAEMKCDPAMILRLRRMCDDPDRGIGHYAIDALATVGREAVAELIGLMRRHPDEDFRRSAAGHLCKMGRDAIEAAPALMEAMWEDDAVIGWQIADFFADLGKESKPFLCEFLCSLEHEDCGVRWHAMRALVKLRPWVPDAVERIAEQFSNLDESDLSAAIDIAAAIGPDAKFAIPMLRRAMIEGESHVRFSAAVAHWKIQPEDHVYSLMREAMSWPSVATEAAVWAWKIGRDEAALLILVNRYTYPAGGFGCGHESMDFYRGYFPAIEAIRESLNDRQQRVRDLAKAALEEMRP